VNLAISRRLRQTVNSLNLVYVSRENRKLLTVLNDSSQSRSFWKDFISIRSRYECSSRYSIPANESRVNRKLLSVSKESSYQYENRNPRSFTSKSQIFRPRSSWKDLISARSRNDSEYCIQLLYLSENDLSENDYDLFWISEILLFSQDLVRFSEFFEFSSFFSTFFRLHFSSSLLLKGWIFSTRRAVVRSVLLRKDQNRSGPATPTYFLADRPR
jgi:hypothetical protein